MFPLKNYKYNLPTGDDLGAFGVERKHDMHTGIDLYAEMGDSVYAIEEGEIVAIEWFTGPKVDMPWWNDTQAIAIRGKSGVINYGELIVNETLKVGMKVAEGDFLGCIFPVLRKDKGKVPSINMLHLELYSEYNGQWVMWELGRPKPENILDPTSLLMGLIRVEK